MKKFILLMTVPAVLMFVSCEKEKVVQADDLPGKASGFISTHYADRTILQVVKERDELRTGYTVFLDNNTKLEFNKEGDIKEIEGTGKIPDSVLPVLIVDYVKTHYPAAFIRGWDPNTTSQEVELSNNLTLLFDSNGNFLRIDD